MIKYHVLALLFLAAAAISAMEFLAIYLENPKSYLLLGKFWLMLLVFGSSIAMYLRVRRFRKEALKGGRR
jgi:hypothetical protein